MTCKAIKYRAMTSQSSLTPARRTRARDVSPAVDALVALGDGTPSETPNLTLSQPHNHSISQSQPDASHIDTLTVSVSDAVPEADIAAEMSHLRTSTPMPPHAKSSRTQHLWNKEADTESDTNCDTPMSPDQSAIQVINAEPNTSAISSQHDDNPTSNSSQTDSPASYHSMTQVDRESGGVAEGGDESHNSSTQTEDEDLHERLRVPIVGYEVMEERARFTIFKVQVRKSELDCWFIFRRYTDFVRLNDRLRRLFPHFRLALPPKRWFGDNFDRCFLDDRLLGLQAFANNVAGHKDVLASKPVRRFFCLDEPPGPHESLEESRALCESLEDENYLLQREAEDKDTRISLLQEELSLQQKEIDNLKKTIRLMGRSERRRGSAQSELSITDTSALAEADQQRLSNTDWSDVPVTRRSPIRERGLYDNHRLSLGNMSVQSMERVPEEQDKPCDRTADLSSTGEPKNCARTGNSPTTGSDMDPINSSARKISPLSTEDQFNRSSSRKKNGNGSMTKSKQAREMALNHDGFLGNTNGKTRRNMVENSQSGIHETKLTSSEMNTDTALCLKGNTSNLTQNDVKVANLNSGIDETISKPSAKQTQSMNQSRHSVERDCESMTSSISGDSLQIIDHGSGKFETYRSETQQVSSGAN